ncbi:MAG: porin family protein [Methyloceanibacter sp.]|nr:porin family protein [Methyloceanibacter sp.]
MNRILLASAVCMASLTSAASADDATGDWSGLQGSAYIGYAAVDSDLVEYGVGPFRGDTTDSGAAIGVGLGYSLDLGSIVVGADTDISLLAADGNIELKNTIDTDYDWFATGRLKTGVDLGDSMVYGTGGVALMDVTLEASQKDSKTLVGWTVGAGAEHKVSDTWSLKAEFLYADFGKETLDTGFDTDIDSEIYTGRVGLSYWLN